MGKAKDIRIKVLPPKVANKFMKAHHYSKKVVNNSNLHFGCFLGNRLGGVMSFGSPLDKKKVLGLVHDANGKPVKWNEMLELNRMAFSELLPRNSESRCIAVAIKLLKKNAPHIRWLLSFSDATQCGDGTIYRASGFHLTAINKSKNLAMLEDGTVIHKMTLESNPTIPRKELNGKSYYQFTGGKYDFKAYAKHVGSGIIEGFQLRYILLIDKTCTLNCPDIPFSRITEMGAGMYKGQKRD